MLAKYVALYAADLIKSNDPISALKLYTVHGAPPLPQNFNIYRRLSMEVFGLTDEAMTGYFVYANLRDILLNLVSYLAGYSCILLRASVFLALLDFVCICTYSLYTLSVTCLMIGKLLNGFDSMFQLSSPHY